MEKFLEFEKKIKNTTWEDFALLPDPYPWSDEAVKNFVVPQELQLAVEKIQDIIIAAVKETYESITRYSFFEAADLVYWNIDNDLDKVAGKYGVTDTTSRERICEYLDDFFKDFCTG